MFFRSHFIGASDRQILSAIGRGDLRQFDAFADRYKIPLFNYCSQRLGDRWLAEDAAQETLLRAFRFTARHGPPESDDIRPWLFTIARHCVDDHLRARCRKPLQMADLSTLDLSDTSASPVDAANHSEERHRLLAAMNALPAEQQEVVHLRLYGELTLAQMADVLGVPEGTIKSRMRYALSKLREALNRQEESP